MAGDGLRCNLIHMEGQDRPRKGPVLLVHGAGVRADIFRSPLPTTIVDALVRDGYDVWLENWRASIDLAPNPWTLDQAALYDHPKAVQTVLRETGSQELKAIVHCQGSTSFTMSAVAGLLPEVTVIVSNAVSLHPVVPPWSRFKLNFLIPMVGAMTEYVSPGWGLRAPSFPAKLLATMTRLTHRECGNLVCRMVSVTYGSGFPALWRHENLSEETHEWLKREFANVPIRFFRQMARCVRAGHLVPYDQKARLPADLVAGPPKTSARFAFFAGERNRCFLPQSQVESFRYFDGQRPGFHSLHVLPNYGHLDVFWGKHASRDVFPLMIGELNKAS